MIARKRCLEPDEITRALFDACDALMIVLDTAAKASDEDLYREARSLLLAGFSLAERRMKSLKDG